MIRSKKEVQRIRKICDTCEHRRKNKCGYCGCNLTLMIKTNIKDCELGKWE